MTVNASAALFFQDPSDTPGADIALDLDEEKNRQVYGQSKTTFAPGETAYLRLISSSDAAYTLLSSAGSLSRAASRVPYAEEENLFFSQEKTARLRHLPRGGVSWQWLGHSAGTPLFAGRSVSINSPAVAVLNCQYETLGDRFRLRVSAAQMEGHSDFEVNAVAVQGDQSASCRVRFSVEEGGGEPQPVDLQVRDFCSGEDVEEVEVFLDGAFIGKTSASGRIYLGMLIPGSVHQLKMVRAGYVDSDLDVLHNDSFTVPSASTA